GIVFQAKDASVEDLLKEKGVEFFRIGKVTEGKTLKIKNGDQTLKLDIPELRDTWSRTSFLLDQKQSGRDNAAERYRNYAKQPLHFKFPEGFSGKLPLDSARGDKQRIKAAIIREKGSNSEREMAYAMDLAGFDV